MNATWPSADSVVSGGPLTPGIARTAAVILSIAAFVAASFGVGHDHRQLEVGAGRLLLIQEVHGLDAVERVGERGEVGLAHVEPDHGGARARSGARTGHGRR